MKKEELKMEKQYIVDKLVYKHISLILLSNCCFIILSLFKSMVLFFERNESQVHKLLDLMIINMRGSLACFMEHGVLKNLQKT